MYATHAAECAGRAVRLLLCKDAVGLLAAFKHILVEYDVIDAVERRQVEHGVEQYAFQYRTKPARAGLALDRAARDRRKRILGKAQLHALHVEQLLILLDKRVLRLGEDLDERRLVKVFQGRDHRQTADALRNEAELDRKSTRLNSRHSCAK